MWLWPTHITEKRKKEREKESGKETNLLWMQREQIKRSNQSSFGADYYLDTCLNRLTWGLRLSDTYCSLFFAHRSPVSSTAFFPCACCFLLWWLQLAVIRHSDRHSSLTKGHHHLTTITSSCGYLFNAWIQLNQGKMKSTRPLVDIVIFVPGFKSDNCVRPWSDWASVSANNCHIHKPQ